MTRRTHRTLVAALAAATLPLGAACDQGQGTDATAGPTPTATAVATDGAATMEAYMAAVQRTIDAPTLSTDARIRVQTSSGVAEVVIEVERTPEGRTLTLGTDQGTVTYVVTDEGATVDRGDGPQAIEVAEVPSPPSLSSLLDLEDLRFPEPGVATGTLVGDELATEVDPSGGAVDVVVRYAADGLVNGVELRGPDDGYVAIVAYRTA